MSAYYVSTHGHDDGAGTKVDPWMTLTRTNALPPGSVVYIEDGTYTTTPTAAGVTYIGNTGDRSKVVVTPTVKLRGQGTTLIGLSLNGGLDLTGRAFRNTVLSCYVGNVFSMNGLSDFAPSENIFRLTKFGVRSFWGHAWGDDRDLTVPLLRGNRFLACDIVVTRDVGKAGVLWRWSGVHDSVIAGCRVSLRQPDQVGGSDDSASLKWLYCQGNHLVDTHFIFDHPPGGTGPFWMWRDKTSNNVIGDCYFQILRGSLWFSPNTAGTWICSCDNNEWYQCTWLIHGDLLWYQCPPNDHDVWVDCTFYVDGHFDKYGVAVIPPGVTVLQGRQ